MLDPRSARRTIILALAPLALGACEPSDGEDGGDSDDGMASFCETDDRADAFSVDLSKMGEHTRVQIVEAVPAQPARGDNTWTVMVTDAGGAPMEGMAVDVKPWMPDHGHGSPVEEEVTDLGAGEYEATPLNLFMAGFWTVTFDVTDAEGATDSVVFNVCVD